MIRIVAVLALLLGAIAAMSAQLDSQFVLERYELEMSDLAMPKTTIVSYTISQAGPTNIEAHHRIYRKGLDVRDETISVDGAQLKIKVARFNRHENHYALERLAPRSTNYSFLFLRPVRDGSHLDYEFEATPLVTPPGGFAVKQVTIDGERFLPRKISFTSGNSAVQGSGEIVYGPSGKFWVPLEVIVDAKINGKPARESITWSDYRFPPDLPASTFQAPRALPNATPQAE